MLSVIECRFEEIGASTRVLANRDSISEPPGATANWKLPSFWTEG
jgi:hypothetical protein